MTQDDRMETIAAETDNPTVCITHGRFIPCRNEDWHHFTDNPYWVKSVRDFQGSDDPNLTWEPATLTITDPALIRATDEPDERGDFPCCTTPAPVGAAVAPNLDALHETICDKFTGMAEVRQSADLLVAEVRRLVKFRDWWKASSLANAEDVRRLTAICHDWRDRSEAAEAEVGTLRAQVAAVEALVNNGQTVGWIERDGDAAWIAADAIRAALATTGEGQ